MKKLKTQYWSLLVASIFSACSSLPKADKAVLSTPSVSATIGIPKDEELRSDTTSTYVRFIGHGVGHSHAGQFKLKEGKVQLQGQNLVGGYFVIDIQSMKLEDQSSGVQQKLRPHLLSSDFFNVQKYPYAMFNIYKTEPYHGHSVLNANYMVSGGLTMKGVTRSISFPAQIRFQNGTVKARANFNINRSWWNMSYGSDRSLGNKFISDEVNVQLDCNFKL